MVATSQFLPIPFKIVAIIFLYVSCNFKVFGERPPEYPEINYLDPAEGIFLEQWMAVYIAGDKAGWGHLTLTRDGDEIHTRNEVYMKIARGPVAIELETEESTVESLTGEPKSFSYTMTMSNQPTSTSGVIADGEVTLTTTGPGYSNTNTIPFPKGALMTWGLSLLENEKGIEPGTEYKALVYSPSLSPQQAFQTTISIGDMEAFEYMGTKLEGSKMISTMQYGPSEITTLSWLDASGEAILTTIDMMGMPMEMVLVDEQTALKDFVAPELMASTLIEIGEPIPSDAESVTYKLKLKDGDFSDVLPPESYTQKVKWNPSTQEVTVTVSRADHALLSDLEIPADGDFSEYLKGNLIVTSDDVAVQKLSMKAHSNLDESALERAYVLCKFVHDHIDEKNLNVGFATASEVVDNPEGDCTEHAVLLAALGRAQGIPSRVATGLVYVPYFQGKENVMGFHAWTQFYIGGQWLDFDATTNELVTGPSRIAFDYSSLQSDSIVEGSMYILELVGNLDVKVVDIKR